MDWTSQPNYPRPDFLSSSRKRLAPQLMFKGGILNYWEKKMAVALDSKVIQAKVDEKLEAAPINNTLDNPLGG